MNTIASIDDVRNAGNFSKKIKDETLTFYVEFVSYFFQSMLGAENYAKAVAGTLTPAVDNDKLKKAEALMTAGYVLPAIATIIAETGMLQTVSVGGRGANLELMSYAKEITDLAANFISIAYMMIPTTYLQDESYRKIWFQSVQRVFPGLDEMPTMGTLHSYAESLIQAARGDRQYYPETEG